MGAKSEEMSALFHMSNHRIKHLAWWLHRVSLMLICIIIDAPEVPMRTAVTIDDELYQRALDMADPGMNSATRIAYFVRFSRSTRCCAIR
jgi:hypothetical protein